MEQAQVLHAGPACRECRMLNMRCDRMTPCGTCTRRGLQPQSSPGRRLDGQLSGTSELHTLGGLEQRSSAAYGHVRPLEQYPDHATSSSLSTTETFPPFAGNFMTNAQHLHSWGYLPLSENIHRPGSVPRIHTNSSPMVGMNTKRLQRGDLSDQDTLAFGTAYTPSLSGTNPVPVSSNCTPYNYAHETRSRDPGPVTPSLQPNQPTHHPLTRFELPFNNFSAPIYRHPEGTFPAPQGQPLATGPSLGPGTEREALSGPNVVQLSGRSLPLPRLGIVASNGPPASPNIPLSDRQMSEEDIYGQVWGFATPKVPANSQARRNPKCVVRSRPRPATVRDHFPYQDDRLRSKYPKEKQDTLEQAIKFQEEHGRTKAIPHDLLDDLLKEGRDGKYLCFCCPGARKARTITPARDHVRKSLGNFPFECNNAWCNHTSLRQADLNKHMKTCINQTSSNSTNISGATADP